MEHTMIDLKSAFIKSAVRVVARDGLEDTTTKAIAAEAKLNEAYIYRCFNSKDELLSTAFQEEDENFARLIKRTLPVLKMEESDFRERAYLLWKAAWDFILANQDDCLFYLRYYYSANFRSYAYDSHLDRFRSLAEQFRKMLKTDVSAEMLLHQIFDTMLSFAARILSGEIKNDAATEKWVFEQMYSFLMPNIRPEILLSKL